MFETEHRRYGELGADYFWFAGKRSLVWSLLDPYLTSIARPTRILDLGCGPGYAFTELSRWGRVVGVDPSYTALRSCAHYERHDAVVVNGAADQLPFREEMFSLLAAFDVIEHLDDDLAALRECRRVLRPGGLLVLTVPAFQWLWGDHDDLYFHKRRYRVAELEERFRLSAFDVLKLTYCEAIFLPPLWILRKLKKMLPGFNQVDDFMQPPTWLNVWLTKVIESEAPLLRKMNLPWGVSIIGIARKA